MRRNLDCCASEIQSRELPPLLSLTQRCPLVAETKPGDPTVPSVAADCDLRTDFAEYNIYRNGKLIETRKSIEDLWTEDSVGFLIGCSLSFEEELAQAGLTPRHVKEGTNVTMYKTKVPLCAAGGMSRPVLAETVFSGNMVVSARPYLPSQLEKVRDITRRFTRTHGEPVAWGPEGAAALGITDLDGSSPDFGDPMRLEEGEIPVYWGCGVTPQNVVMSSGIEGIVIGHMPGQMLVMDLKNENVKE